jgi:hypothetical protein
MCDHPCCLRRGGAGEIHIPSLSIERAHGTPDARCVRSLVCKKWKAHERSSPRRHRTRPAFRARRFCRLAPRTGPPAADPCVLGHRWWRTDEPPTRKACDGSASGRKGDCAGTSRFGPSSPRRRRQSPSPHRVTPARSKDIEHRGVATASRLADRDDREPPLSVRRDE